MSNDYDKYMEAVSKGQVLIAFTQQWLTYNPGVQEFKILEEGEKFFVVDAGDGKPSAIEKHNSVVNEDRTKLMIMESIVR